MADQLEEIKSKIDIVEFINGYLPLKKAGRNFKALCPFHSEKTPSFVVSPERQIWKCFGCGKSGDIFGFLMEIEKIEFGEALRTLAKKAGVILTGYRPTQPEAEKEKLYQINHLASEFYHYLLVKHDIGKKALDYILKRGISRESLEKFKLGYAPAMWDGLQKFLVGKKGFKEEDLEKAGLVIRATNYYDRFRERLMFPLADHRGNIVGFSGRVLDLQIKEAKYINTPETLTYHKGDLLYPLEMTKEEIKKENSTLVVEGELDAISSYQVGIKNVVAIKGSALTEPQCRLLKRFTENLFLALDTDFAGDSASRRGIEIADKVGFNLRVVVLEKYKDPDEAVQKEPDYLKEQIRKAQNIYDFLIDSAFKRFSGQTPEEKKKIGQELVPVLAKIEDEIVKNVFVKKLAEKLGVNEEAIVLQIERLSVKAPTIVPASPIKTHGKTRREVIEEYFLALVFQSKKPQILLDAQRKSLLKSPAFSRLIEFLKDYFGKKKKFSSQFFFKTLPAELQETFDKFYMIDFGQMIEDEGWVEKEIKKTQRQLEMVIIKEELQDCSKELKDKGLKLSSVEEEKIKRKIRRLTQELAVLEKEG